VERRTKEIGVRKVLGASVVNIIRLLVREFIILIAISNIIALPAAYFITNSLFMSRIAFSRVEIGVGILLLTSALTFITAVIAVTSQTVKAAQGNPINALKYE
jgi:putative ABC transport system permease protein